MIICKWCGIECRNNQSLAGHCRINHSKEWTNERVSKQTFCNLSEDKTHIKCPCCDYVGTSLYHHLRCKHNQTKEQIQHFKQSGFKLHVDTRTRTEHSCSICNSKFELKNALQSHMKSVHTSQYEKLSVHYADNEHVFTCQCCGQLKRNLIGHIQASHPEHTWMSYCKKYNHDPKNTYFMTDKHKESLSKNKLKFYNETARGRELREIQKTQMSVNNPSMRHETKLKISASAIDRMLNNENMGFVINARGIFLGFIYENKDYYVRSLEEFKILYTLLINNESFLYEGITVSYYLNDAPKTYILDLKYQNVNIEIKSDITNINKEKYQAIADVFSKSNEEFVIMDYESFCVRFGFYQYTTEYFTGILNDMMTNGDLTKYLQIVKATRNSRIVSGFTENNKNKIERKILTKGRVLYEYSAQ